MSIHWDPPQSELHRGLRGLTLSDVHEESRAIAAKHYMPDDQRQNSAPLITPITHSATYRLQSVDAWNDISFKGGYIYGRCGNPTVEAAECAINALEGGAGTLLFSSGLAALSTTFTFILRPGDHIIACNPIYSGTHKFLSKYFCPNFNVEITWVKAGCSIDEYGAAIKSNTKLMYGETPGNPTQSMIDLEEFGKLGKSSNILTCIDSTFAGPYAQQPIKYGIDLVAHSCTKYISGHADVTAGCITLKSLEMYKEMNVYRGTVGCVLSPFDASLVLRGIKTLHVRMEKHSENAQAVAEYLEKHPKVEKVFYAGLKSDPYHHIAKKQMRCFGGMLSFEVKGGTDQTKTLAESLRLVCLAVSLGGTESLINPAAAMTHGPMLMDQTARIAAGITPGLMRLSVGLENADDIIKDFEQAFEKIP